MKEMNKTPHVYETIMLKNIIYLFSNTLYLYNLFTYYIYYYICFMVKRYIITIKSNNKNK